MTSDDLELGTQVVLTFTNDGIFWVVCDADEVANVRDEGGFFSHGKGPVAGRDFELLKGAGAVLLLQWWTSMSCWRLTLKAENK
jgi:hypothetical protein